MDFMQLATAGVVAVGMLVVALLAIVPTMSECPTSQRRRDLRNTAHGPVPVKVRHRSLRR